MALIGASSASGASSILDARAGGAQRRQAALEGGGDGRVEAVEHHPASARRNATRTRAAAAAARPAREDFVQHDGVAHRARDRAGGVERGRQRPAPSIGTSRAVFLKPTRPCSAAGIRIEPPVSEPSAAQAAPAATETAPPEVEPPGTRAFGRGERRRVGGNESAG